MEDVGLFEQTGSLSYRSDSRYFADNQHRFLRRGYAYGALSRKPRNRSHLGGFASKAGEILANTKSEQRELLTGEG